MKKIKKIVSAMLAVTCTFSMFAMTSCDNNNASLLDTVKGWFSKTDEEVTEDGAQDDGADETPEGGLDNNVGDEEVPEDGAGDKEPVNAGDITMSDSVQYLRAGGSYNLSKSVAFLSTDVATTASYTPVTATLTATVTPIDAYQRVDWSWDWLNASSAWAKNKAVIDYVTIAPKSDGSTKLDVTCKQPFGEPIKITCTSRANNNVSASVVVDFLGVPELQTVTLGSGSYAITVNLGGETTVPFNYKGTDYGGELAVGTYKSSSASVYTKLAEVDDYDVFNFDLVSPGVYYNRDTSNFTDYEDGYLTADVDDNLGTTMSGKTYFDDLGIRYHMGQQYFSTLNLDSDILVAYTTMMSAPFTEAINKYDTSKVIKMLNSLSENSLYTFVLHVEVGGVVQTYYSLMKLQIVQ